MKSRFFQPGRGIRTIALALACLAVWPKPDGHAAGIEFDFRPANVSEGPAKGLPPSEGLVRCHAVEAKPAADASAIRVGDVVTVKLFDDVEFQLQVREREPAVRETDPVSFLASTEGEDGPCNVVLVVDKDGLDVDVQAVTSGKRYRVYSHDGTATVYENAPSTQKHACGTKPLPVTLFGDGTGENRSPQNTKSTTKAVSTYVDTLLVFDRAASSWVSRQGSDVDSFAATAVAKMNTALANTGLDSSFRYRLAGTHVLSGNGGSDLGAVLDAVTDGTTYNGVDWSTIRTVRNSKGADVVSILIDIGDTSQLGTVTTGIGHCPMTGGDYSVMEDYTFNVCAVAYVAQDHTMTHETGHNLGCGHADNVNTAAISPGPGIYSYSSGYHFTASGTPYFTIMAYNYDGYGNIYQPCPYFSSPDYRYNGVAVGNSTHDNTRTIRENFATAAGFRDGSSYDFVFPASGGTAEALTLSWYADYYVTGYTLPGGSEWIGTALNSDSANERTTHLIRVEANTNAWVRTGSITFNYSNGGSSRTFTVKQEAGDAPPAPANDNFSSPVTISGSSGSHTGSNAGATMQSGEPRPTVQTNSNASVWFKWTAPASGTATFDTVGSGFDTVLAVYTGSSVSSLTQIAANDDGGGNRCSLTNFAAIAGTTYRIAVYGFAQHSGDYVLNWSLEAESQSDYTLTVDPNGGVLVGSNFGDKEGTGDPASVTVTYGTQLYWRLGTATRSGCEFDGWWTRATGGDQVYAASGDAIPGTLYWDSDYRWQYRNNLAVYAHWTTNAAAAPANDNFSSPVAFSSWSGSHTGSNEGATMQSGEPRPTVQTNSNASVWFKWTAPASGTVTFDTIGSSFDTVLAVYTGASVSSLTQIAADDDGAADNCSLANFSAVAGTTYRIAVYGYSDRTGTYKLNWLLEEAAAPVVYGIGYSLDGGTKGSRAPTNATYGTAFRVSAPTKGGCTFAGWSVSSGLDSSTAKWGTGSNPTTAIPGSGTKCVNGTNDVYFLNLRSTAGSVTLKANWTTNEAPVVGDGTNRYAVCVGINEYDTSYCNNWLTGCAPDARHMTDLVTSRGEWNAANTTLLTDGEATLANIRKAISNAAARAESGDHFLYYHSSHGGNDVAYLTSSDGDYYLHYGLDSTGVSNYICSYNKDYTAKMLATDLSAFKAGVKIVVMMDTCHSAGMFKYNATAKSRKALSAKLAEARAGNAPAGGAAAGEPEPENSVPGFFMEAVMEQLEQIRADQVRRGLRPRTAASLADDVGWIAAADYDQYSWDGATGGAFTAAFIDGVTNADRMCDNATYGNRDGQASFYEGWNYAKDIARGQRDGSAWVYDWEGDYYDYWWTDAQCTNTAVLDRVLVGWTGPGTSPSGDVPGNDDFEAATTLSGSSGRCEGSNVGATVQPDEPRPTVQTNVNASVWFKWTAPASGTATFDTIGSSFDTVLAVYTGSSVSSLTQIAANDDDDEMEASTSWVSFAAAAGTTYYIAVYGFADCTGAYVLNWILNAHARPANDRYADAENLGKTAGGTAYGDNTGATWEEGEPLVADGADDWVTNPVWWMWTAPATGVARFDTIGSDFDTVLAVYTNASPEDIGSLTLVASDDDGAGIGRSSLAWFNTTAKRSYWIAVMGYNADASGPITLNWQQHVWVKFNGNGATSGSMGARTNVYNTATALPACGFERTGYECDGWATSATGTVAYALDASPAFKKNTTLYAHWVAAPQPNLRGYKPKAWPAAIFLTETAAGTNVTESVWTGETAYLRFCYGNFGEVAMGTHRVSAVVTNAAGQVVASGSWTNGGLAVNAILPGILEVRVDEAGSYAAVVTLDPDGAIAESDESDNEIRLEFTAATARPANDDYAAAADLGKSAAGAVAGSNAGATWEVGEPKIYGSYYRTNSVWWTWTAPATGVARFDTVGSEFDTVMTVFTNGTPGDIATLKAVKSDDNGGGNGTSRVWFNTVAKRTYWIAVAGRTAQDSGAIALNWQQCVKVAFKGNGATAGSMRTLTNAYNTATALPACGFEKEGYVCDGWATSASGTVAYALDAAPAFTKNTTLYAHWIAATQTVWFDANGGTCKVLSRTAVVGETYTKLASATREGYKFAGWYDAPEGGNRVKIGDPVPPQTERTLFAHWEGLPQTVWFDANGGTCKVLSRTAVVGDVYTKLASATRDGYKFAGWYDAPEGGNRVKIGDPVPPQTERTLFAHWEGLPQTVRFDANGGTCKTSSRTAVVGETYTKLASATRDGYKFAGWYDAPEGGNRVKIGDPVPPQTERTLFAHWEALSQTVWFDANGGTCKKESVTCRFGETYSGFTTATWAGHSFQGWYDDPEGGKRVKNGMAVTGGAERILYAHWKEAAAALSITGFSRSPRPVSSARDAQASATEYTLRAETSAGVSYEIQWTPALDGGWTVVKRWTAPAEGETSVPVVLPADSPAGFFRLVETDTE